MTKKYIIIVTFAFILGIIGFQVLDKPDENQSPRISAPSESIAERFNLDTQTNNEGPISISVTPKNLSDTEWAFEIALDTHSVDIEEDLIKVSVLTDENGNEYKPIAWQGDPPGSHHREGILQFASIASSPESIMLKINNVGGIEERNFIWQLRDLK